MSNYGNEGGNTALANRNTRIEEKIDRQTVGELAISNAVGGVSFQTVVDLMEFAKLMSVSGICIPKHLRGEPGACLAICMQAVEWRMSPYAVANKSYAVNDRIAYESQLIHAVIEQRAPLVGRLRATYDGEGPTRRCIITGHIKGEAEPLVFTSSPFAKINPKNSPLWQTKPDLQLFYNASRDWARMYFPDLILGVVSSDEVQARELPPKTEVSRTAALAQRFATPTPPVVHRPADANRVIDTATSNLPPADVAEEIPRNAPRAPGSVVVAPGCLSGDAQEKPEQDVAGEDAEEPPIDLSTFEGFAAAFRRLSLTTAGLSQEKFDVAMARVCVDHRIKQPGIKGDTVRKYIYEAAANGALDWATGKIV